MGIHFRLKFLILDLFFYRSPPILSGCQQHFFTRIFTKYSVTMWNTVKSHAVLKFHNMSIIMIVSLTSIITAVSTVIIIIIVINSEYINFISQWTIFVTLVTANHQWTPAVTREHLQLLADTSSHQKTPSVTSEHLQSPEDTSSH